MRTLKVELDDQIIVNRLMGFESHEERVLGKRVYLPLNIMRLTKILITHTVQSLGCHTVKDGKNSQAEEERQMYVITSTLLPHLC